MTSTDRSSGRRLGVLTMDQAVAGGSNVLIALLAAQLLSPASFGFFFIVFLVYGMLQGTGRALVGDPLLLHPTEARERAGEALGVGVILGIGLAVVSLLAGVVTYAGDARLGEAFFALAVCVPLLVLQDLGRYLAIATRRPAGALFLDVVWLILMLVGIGVLFVAGSKSLWQFIGAWGLSGAIAGALVFWQHRGVRISISLGWLRETWSISWRYLIAYMSAQGSALATAVVLTVIAGARATGGVQGALLLQRPFVLFVVAAMASGVVDISHSDKASSTVRGIVVKVTVYTTVVAVVVGAVPLLFSDSVGEIFLGDSWHEADPLLLAAAVQIVMMGLTSGGRAGLLGLRAVRLSTVIDVSKTVVVIVFAAIGAAIGGAEAAMWAVAIGHGVGAIIWWSALGIQVRRMGLSADVSGSPVVLEPGVPAETE